MFEDKVSALNRSTAEMPLHYEKRTYSVSEIQDILEIGRNAAYDLVKKGYFSTVKIGGIIRISKKSFDAWVDGQGSSCQVYEEA